MYSISQLQNEKRLRWIILLGLAAACLLCVPARAMDPGLDTGPAIYDLYTASIPPYTAPAPGGKIKGTLVPVVYGFLEERGIRFRASLLPWSAAYRRAESNPNALIFPLDRTAVREDKFHWILPLETTHYYLYGLRGYAKPDTSLEDIVRAGDKVSCTRNSIQCQLLVKNGLPDANILRIEGASIPERRNLIVRKRNYYSVFDPIVYERLTTQNGIDGSRLIRLMKVGEMTSYLAANKGLPVPALNSLQAEPRQPAGD